MSSTKGILGNSPIKKVKTPVWKGPEIEGVTSSLLSRYLSCKERFRCLVVEGLKLKESFHAPIHYGNMWHLCEEWFAKTRNELSESWLNPLRIYCEELCKKHPFQQEEINKWYSICKMMFPIYVGYWKAHPDVLERTPIFQEQVFDVVYKLPNGRKVRLRGKWDAVDMIGSGKDAGIYLFDTKTKGDPNAEQIQRQLTFDIQMMTYLVALEEYSKDKGTPYKDSMTAILKQHPIKGIRYNVVRRPRQYQGKKETKEAFLLRLEEIVRDDPGSFFMRWKVAVSPQEITEFRRKFLNPILMNLCEWWDWVSRKDIDPFKDTMGIHWQHPFGGYNALDEGGSTHLDEYLNSGDERGLIRTSNLYPELT